MRQFSIPAPRYTSLLFATLIIAAHASAIPAETQSKGPSTASPDNALLVTFFPRLGNWRTEGLKTAQRIETALQQLESSDDDVAEVEKTYGDILALYRLGEILTTYREPAGSDFTARAQLHDAALREIATRIAENPAAKRSVQRRIDTLDSALATARKKLSKVSPDAKRGDYVAACEGLYRLMDPLEEQGLWWSIVNGQRHPQMASWDKTSLRWFSMVLRQYKVEAIELADKALEQHSVDYESFLNAIKAAAQSMAAAGRAEVSQGSSLNGPQTIEHFGKAWVDLQLRALRHRSFARIRKILGSSPAINLDAAHSKFCGQVASSLGKIIEADAQRASADEALQLYDEYLRKLPPIISRSPQLKLTSVFGPPLNKLAEKSTELSADIKAYRACTSDLLRWRERTAAAYTRARRQSYASLTDQVQAATKSRGALLTRGNEGGTVASVYTAVPQLVDEASKLFMENDVSVSNLVLSRRNGSFAISPLIERSIAYVPIASDTLAAAQGHLGADLFAPGNAVAPTLEAQMALYTARQGDLQAAGGTVLNIGFIGWAARYALLNEDDRGLVRPGPFPEEVELIQEHDLIVLFMIKPSWLAHRHFFVSLTPKVAKP